MTTKELVLYIKKQLEKDVAKDSLAKSLVNAGWTMEAVQTGIQRAEREIKNGYNLRIDPRLTTEKYEEEIIVKKKSSFSIVIPIVVFLLTTIFSYIGYILYKNSTDYLSLIPKDSDFVININLDNDSSQREFLDENLRKIPYADNLIKDIDSMFNDDEIFSLIRSVVDSEYVKNAVMFGDIEANGDYSISFLIPDIGKTQGNAFINNISFNDCRIDAINDISQITCEEESIGSLTMIGNHFLFSLNKKDLLDIIDNKDFFNTSSIKENDNFAKLRKYIPNEFLYWIFIDVDSGEKQSLWSYDLKFLLASVSDSQNNNSTSYLFLGNASNQGLSSYGYIQEDIELSTFDLTDSWIKDIPFQIKNKDIIFAGEYQEIEDIFKNKNLDISKYWEKYQSFFGEQKRIMIALYPNDGIIMRIKVKDLTKIKSFVSQIASDPSFKKDTAMGYDYYSSPNVSLMHRDDEIIMFTPSKDLAKAYMDYDKVSIIDTLRRDIENDRDIISVYYFKPSSMTDEIITSDYNDGFYDNNYIESRDKRNLDNKKMRTAYLETFDHITSYSYKVEDGLYMSKSFLEIKDIGKQRRSETEAIVRGMINNLIPYYLQMFKGEYNMDDNTPANYESGNDIDIITNMVMIVRAKNLYHQEYSRYKDINDYEPDQVSESAQRIRELGSNLVILGNNQEYCAYVKLLSSPEFYCVDSFGFSGEVNSIAHCNDFSFSCN